jgi:molybdate transport system regulatory protein
MGGIRKTRQAPHRVAPGRIIKGRIWVEIGGNPALNDSSADLLEQIEAAGSLSEAARRLGFSYRRAWLLLDMLNRKWPQPFVLTATGGHHGGGAKITELGRHVLQTYRDLQIQLEHLLNAAGDPFCVTS